MAPVIWLMWGLLPWFAKSSGRHCLLMQPQVALALLLSPSRLAAQVSAPYPATPQYQLPHLYTANQDIPSQRVALETLYHAAGGPSWTFTYQFGSGGDIPRYSPHGEAH